MDKVKTFVAGLISKCYHEAFEYLDGCVAELGDIEIKSINDQYLCRAGLHSKNEALSGIDECVKRIIVYRTLDNKIDN